MAKNLVSGPQNSNLNANLLKGMMASFFFHKLKFSRLLNTIQSASIKKISITLFLNFLQRKIKTSILNSHIRVERPHCVYPNPLKE